MNQLYVLLLGDPKKKKLYLYLFIPSDYRLIQKKKKSRLTPVKMKKWCPWKQNPVWKTPILCSQNSLWVGMPISSLCFCLNFESVICVAVWWHPTKHSQSFLSSDFRLIQKKKKSRWTMVKMQKWCPWKQNLVWKTPIPCFENCLWVKCLYLNYEFENVAL